MAAFPAAAAALPLAVVALLLAAAGGMREVAASLETYTRPGELRELRDLPRAPLAMAVTGAGQNLAANEDIRSGEKVAANPRVPVSSVAILTLLMAAATGLGALPFFFLTLEPAWAGICNGMACGVMLAASFDLIQEGQQHGGGHCVMLGVLAGGIFIHYCEKVGVLAAPPFPPSVPPITPHAKSSTPAVTGSCLEYRRMTTLPEFLRCHCCAMSTWPAPQILDQYGDVKLMDLKGAGSKKMVLIVAIMTLHSFGEGSGVGVSFAGPKGLPQGLFVTIAIAIHNIPEGLAVSMVLASRGVPARQAMLWSIFTSLPQPLVAVPAFMCADSFRQFLPFCVGFAAGCMIWMVFGEMMPESLKETSPPAVAGAATVSVAVMEGISTLLEGVEGLPSWEHVTPLGVSLLFGLGPFLGSLVVVTFVAALDPPRTVLTGVAAGAMLVLAVWRPLQLYAKGTMSMFMLAFFLYVGSCLYLAVARLLRRRHPPAKTLDGEILRGTSGPLLSPLAQVSALASGAVALHAVAEGLALGVAAPHAKGMGMYMLLPVSLHGLPRGMAVASSMYGASGNWRTSLAASVLTGFAGPLGAMAAMLAGLGVRGLATWHVVACGCLVPAACSSLLPRAIKLSRPQALTGAALGAFVVLASLMGTKVLCQHTPYCSSAPEAVT
eukprot:SM000157S02086  [mRNA]  locus=s157:197376:200866:+ [translate_table: standard]